MNALHLVLDVFGIINLSNVLLLSLYVVQFVVQSVEYHSESVCTLHRQHCCCVLPGYSYQPSSLANPRTNVTHYMYFSSLVLLCSLHWDDVVALCDTNSSVIAILVLCDWWVCVCVLTYRQCVERQHFVQSYARSGSWNAVHGSFFTSVYSFMDIVKSEIVSCCKNCDCDNLFFNFLIYLHVFL